MTCLYGRLQKFNFWPVFTKNWYVSPRVYDRLYDSLDVARPLTTGIGRTATDICCGSSTGSRIPNCAPSFSQLSYVSTPYSNYVQVRAIHYQKSSGFMENNSSCSCELPQLLRSFVGYYSVYLAYQRCEVNGRIRFTQQWNKCFYQAWSMFIARYSIIPLSTHPCILHRLHGEICQFDRNWYFMSRKLLEILLPS